MRSLRGGSGWLALSLFDVAVLLLLVLLLALLLVPLPVPLMAGAVSLLRL